MKALSRIFIGSDEVWERHASGWSVWTRVATGPLLPLAILSHVWIGWPWSLAMTALLGAWLWLNPRIFAKPKTTRPWHSRAVLGERVWINRNEVPIPAHHTHAAFILSVIAAIGSVIALLGAIAGWVWPTLLGTVVMVLGKLWFCDRMVWLYDDMNDTVPEYRSWLY